MIYWKLKDNYPQFKERVLPGKGYHCSYCKLYIIQ